MTKLCRYLDSRLPRTDVGPETNDGSPVDEVMPPKVVICDTKQIRFVFDR